MKRVAIKPRSIHFVALGLAAVSMTGEAQNRIPTITRAEMQQLTGQPWKCNDYALNWLSESLKRIETIQVGSTRAELLKLFQPSEEVSSRFRQRFDYRDHRDNALFHVEVEFDRSPVRLPANPDEDRVARISTPFISTIQGAPDNQAHITWVDEALRRIQTIKPGMTRMRLFEVFRSQGGISTPLHETYASRDCPLFQADVEFEAVGRPARDADGRVTFPGADQDRIKKITKPYLALERAD